MGVNILSVSLGPKYPQADYLDDAISIGSSDATSHGILVNKDQRENYDLIYRHSGSAAEPRFGKSLVVEKAGGLGMVMIDEEENDVAIPFAIPAVTVRKEIRNKIAPSGAMTTPCSLSQESTACAVDLRHQQLSTSTIRRLRFQISKTESTSPELSRT
ncbi:hypothetical protein GW17_00047195 [Ensete ventricosum]|nr:hypothetical protein GW17_00047195 [Ensete ventricosum]